MMAHALLLLPHGWASAPPLPSICMGAEGGVYGDRLFQIGLFANQRIVLFLNFDGVFLGAQVNRTQGVALSLKAVYIRFDTL